jgi:hypothetical protein
MRRTRSPEVRQSLERSAVNRISPPSISTSFQLRNWKALRRHPVIIDRAVEVGPSTRKVAVDFRALRR